MLMSDIYRAYVISARITIQRMKNKCNPRLPMMSLANFYKKTLSLNFIDLVEIPYKILSPSNIYFFIFIFHQNRFQMWRAFQEPLS